MNLDAVIEELAPRLLRFCRGRASDASLAEEAAQEALVALVDRWRNHGAPDSADAFAFTVARRRLARKQAKQRLFESLDGLFGRSTEEADPERRAMARSRLDLALAGLATLRPKLREALLLGVAGELDTATASKVLGISPSAYKMRLARAREQLQANLREHDHDNA